MDKQNLPRRVIVQELISGRYHPGQRPLSWDVRRPGVEKIKTTEGETLSLYSDGGQSTPDHGWQLLLTGYHASATASETGSVEWTLYGMTGSEVSSKI